MGYLFASLITLGFAWLLLAIEKFRLPLPGRFALVCTEFTFCIYLAPIFLLLAIFIAAHGIKKYQGSSRNVAIALVVLFVLSVASLPFIPILLGFL